MLAILTWSQLQRGFRSWLCPGLGWETVFFLVAGVVLCFGFRMWVMLIIHWCFSCWIYPHLPKMSGQWRFSAVLWFKTWVTWWGCQQMYCFTSSSRTKNNSWWNYGGPSVRWVLLHQKCIQVSGVPRSHCCRWCSEWGTEVLSMLPPCKLKECKEMFSDSWITVSPVTMTVPNGMIVACVGLPHCRHWDLGVWGFISAYAP